MIFSELTLWVVGPLGGVCFGYFLDFELFEIAFRGVFRVLPNIFDRTFCLCDKHYMAVKTLNKQ